MMPDWLVQSGVVLFAADYDACVRFYRDIIGLEVIADHGEVTQLSYGAGYLMIEGGGGAVPAGKSRIESAVTLRFNVADVAAVAASLGTRGVDIVVQSYDWGTVGRFTDPDGNRCELRSHDEGFIVPGKPL